MLNTQPTDQLPTQVAASSSTNNNNASKSVIKGVKRAVKFIKRSEITKTATNVIKTIVLSFVNPFEANKTLRRFITDVRQDGACAKNPYVMKNENQILLIGENEAVDSIEQEEKMEPRTITLGSRVAGVALEVVLFPVKIVENVALMVLGVPLKIAGDAIEVVLEPAQKTLGVVVDFVKDRRSTIEKVLIGLAVVVALGAAVAVLAITAKITIPVAVVITLAAIGVTAYVIRREKQIGDLQETQKQILDKLNTLENQKQSPTQQGDDLLDLDVLDFDLKTS